MSIVYISGPMSGLPDYNYPAFNREAHALREAGLEVRNPADIDGHSGWTWQQWMREALRLQLDADVVHMLPGWRKSRGARIEHRLARILGQQITGANE